MKKMKKPKKRTTLKEDAGKYLLDMSKLIFGSVVISEILRRQIRWIDEDMSHDILLIVGKGARNEGFDSIIWLHNVFCSLCHGFCFNRGLARTALKEPPRFYPFLIPPS